MEKHVHSIDNEKVKDIDILQVDTIYEMATLFKMFADPTRLKIMNVLLNMTHSAISHQLATLKLSNLVKSNKKGKEVYYSLADEHISSILAIGKEHVEE